MQSQLSTITQGLSHMVKDLEFSEPSFWGSLACLVVVALFAYLASRERKDIRTAYWTGVLGLLGAFWGGHLFGDLLGPESAFQDSVELFLIWKGPKAVFGAFLGAALFGGLYLLYRRQPVLPYADAAVPAVALGYAIARIACFLNGDDYGTVTSVPWAVQFHPGTEAYVAHLNRGLIEAGASLSLPVHPTQLYHAAAGLLLFLLLSRWQGSWCGSRLAFAMAGYGVLRFVIEWFRGDALPVIGPLHAAHLFSLAFIAGAAAIWFVKGRRQIWHRGMRFDLKLVVQE
jgi:phosphatidylglycerol:prolipoprotein diacylglycerol transferase